MPSLSLGLLGQVLVLAFLIVTSADTVCARCHFGRDVVRAKLDFKPRQWKFRRTVAAAEKDSRGGKSSHDPQER